MRGETHVDFIETAIKTQTVKEMASSLNLTPKQVAYLIERYHLGRYCNIPATDKVWELIKDKKVQCAVCGMWMEIVNGAHLTKHNLAVNQYKEKYGLNKAQPLCCQNLAEHWKQKAVERRFGQDEKVSAGKKLFKTGKVRAKTYKKSRQALEYRKKMGYQSRAGRAKKPREYLKHVDVAIIKRLKDKDRLSFSAITKIVMKKTGSDC